MTDYELLDLLNEYMANRRTRPALAEVSLFADPDTSDA
jgi:hypothetical protein